MIPFAYIDPFTGALVLQALAAAFFAVIVFFKQCRDFVLGIFGFKRKKAETLDGEPEAIDTEQTNPKEES